MLLMVLQHAKIKLKDYERRTYKTHTHTHGIEYTHTHTHTHTHNQHTHTNGWMDGWMDDGCKQSSSAVTWEHKMLV